MSLKAPSWPNPGVYWTSQFAIGHDNSLRVRIYCENGSIQWFQEEPEKVTVISREGVPSELHRGYGDIKPQAGKYGSLPSGHPEGWLEAMGNLYRSFIECVSAKQNGSFDASMIDFPTVEYGAEGVKFIHACLKSNKEGNVWVDM